MPAITYTLEDIVLLDDATVRATVKSSRTPTETLTITLPITPDTAIEPLKEAFADAFEANRQLHLDQQRRAKKVRTLVAALDGATLTRGQA